MSPQVWQAVFERLNGLDASSVGHIIFHSPCPILWPSGVNDLMKGPIAKLFRGIGINLDWRLASEEGTSVVDEDGRKRQGAMVTDDDIQDGWCHPDHTQERDMMLEQSIMLARGLDCRVSFITGDMHNAARSVHYDAADTSDNRHVVHAVVSSGICANASDKGLGSKLRD